MFEDLNLYSPDFIISCNALTYSNEVYWQMKGNGITRSYVYAVAINDPKQKFCYKIIKIGKSSPNPGDGNVDVGERIARELAHVPGWQYFNGYDPISSHGQDFMNAINRAIKYNKLPKSFNKNMITVGIWNISSRMSTILENAVTTEYLATGYAEGELVNQYKQHNPNSLPILNFVDPSKSKFYSGYISKNVGKLFGWD